MFLIVPDTHSLTSELRRIFIIPLCPVWCWGEASFEESRFTTMPANTRACPCDELQIMQPGFNNLRAKRAHKPLHKAPWSQRASAIVQRRGSGGTARPAKGDPSGVRLSHLHRTHTYSTSSGFLLCRPDLLRPCPTTTRQLHGHNGPVCKCEKLMSHHKNFVSPSWNFEQYLFSCSPRAAPHHPGTERFQKGRHSAADEMKGGGLSFTLFFTQFFFFF